MGVVGLVAAVLIWWVLNCTLFVRIDEALAPVRASGKLCLFDKAPAQTEALANAAVVAMAAGDAAGAMALAEKADRLIEEASDRRHRMLPYRDIHEPNFVETARTLIPLVQSKVRAYRDKCFKLAQ